MTPEIIQMIAQFMQRVTLQGSEVDAYQTCMTVLGQELQKQQESLRTPQESTEHSTQEQLSD